jgi:hypothetical protein
MGEEKETQVYKSLREIVKRLSPKGNPLIELEKRKLQAKSKLLNSLVCRKN